MKRILLALTAIAGLIVAPAKADPDFHSIARWNIHDPTMFGTVAGNFSFGGVVTAVNPSQGNDTQQIATTAWVNQAIASLSGSGSSGSSYCSTSGCTFSGNGGSVIITPWNYQGYNALAIGGMLTFSNGNGTNIGLGYIDDGGGSNPAFNMKNAGLSMDRGLTVRQQEDPSSSQACTAGRVFYGVSGLYYCISSGNVGRILWQTGY